MNFELHYTNKFLFLIYESQNFSWFYKLASVMKGGNLLVPGCYMSPFDFLVIAHFLAWYDCLLDLSYCNLTSQSLEIMHRVNSEHHGTTQIEEVHLSHNPKMMTKLSLIPKLPMFEHTNALIVHGLRYPEGESSERGELLPFIGKICA